MTETVEAYFSFRSPYSYLATPGMLRLRDDFNITLNLRPVLPLAVRRPEFFSPENMKRARYIMIDFPRRAEFLGMACHWPSPDPIVQDFTTFKIADEQPYIYWLSELGVEAQRQGRGIEFAYQISHMLFGGTKDWDKGEHLSEAASRAELDLVAMESAREGGDHAEEIELNQKALEAAHHWGVPTLVFKGDPFFGEDRIDTLRWKLEKAGLKKTE